MLAQLGATRWLAAVNVFQAAVAASTPGQMCTVWWAGARDQSLACYPRFLAIPAFVHLVSWPDRGAPGQSFLACLHYWLARAQAKHAASGMRDQMNTHHWNAVIYSLASLALYGFVGLLVVLAVRKLLVNCCRICVHRGRLPALSTTAAYQAVVDLLPSMEYDVTQFVSLLLQCCTAEQFV